MTNAIALARNESRLSYFALVLTAFALLGLTSCAGMDDTQQKMLSGGAIGAVVGTVGIAITGGCIPCGTAIGGVVGAGAGYLIDQIDKNTKSSPSSTSTSSSSSSNSTSNSYNSNSSSAYNTGGNYN